LSNLESVVPPNAPVKLRTRPGAQPNDYLAIPLGTRSLHYSRVSLNHTLGRYDDLVDCS
jgi:hypothetical protein